MPSAGGNLHLSTELLIQGLTGLCILFWVLKDAIKVRRETRQAVQPNPMVTAVTMAWDSDQKERLLQLVERLAIAAETQAKLQASMAGSWDALADRQKVELTERFDDLLKALDEAERTRKEPMRSSRRHAP